MPGLCSALQALVSQVKKDAYPYSMADLCTECMVPGEADQGNCITLFQYCPG